MNRAIYIGFDPREAAAFAVTRSSVRRHLTQPIPIRGLVLSDLKAKGLYRRPMEWRQSAADKPIMWDVISGAPMSTQHANARFLVPHLAGSGWALFMDGDMLCKGNLARMFDSLYDGYAVYCVKHKHEPQSGVKMDGQVQTEYGRKNWSSFIAFNCEHHANRGLTLDLINTVPGRDLHRLCWLKDDEIGELGPEWNYLVGHTRFNAAPNVIHFTDGVPDMPGYENGPYADEWRAELERWAS